MTTTSSNARYICSSLTAPLSFSNISQNDVKVCEDAAEGLRGHRLVTQHGVVQSELDEQVP